MNSLVKNKIVRLARRENFEFYIKLKGRESAKK